MACLTCAASALRHPDNPKTDSARRLMAKHGFVCCTASEGAATFRPIDSSCANFREAAPETVAARIEWATKNHGHVAQARA